MPSRPRSSSAIRNTIRDVFPTDPTPTALYGGTPISKFHSYYQPLYEYFMGRRWTDLKWFDFIQKCEPFYKMTAQDLSYFLPSYLSFAVGPQRLKFFGEIVPYNSILYDVDDDLGRPQAFSEMVAYLNNTQRQCLHDWYEWFAFHRCFGPHEELGPESEYTYVYSGQLKRDLESIPYV